MHPGHGHIILILLLLLTMQLLAQQPGGGFLYDMGIVIGDSSEQALSDTVNTDTLSEDQQTELQRELERYQEELALTEIRMKRQTRVIDSLKTALSRIQAARETDVAFLNAKLIDLEKGSEAPPESPVAGSDPNMVLDSVYAELTEDETPAYRPPIRKSDPRAPLEEATAIRLYRQGLTKFHKQYYYSAIEDFREVEARGTDQDMRANAQYWIGRSYFEKKLYDEAIIALEKVRQYPESDKQDDALVLIGLAFQQKNEPTEARVAFRELVSQYPASEYLTLARRFIRN